MAHRRGLDADLCADLRGKAVKDIREAVERAQRLVARGGAASFSSTRCRSTRRSRTPPSHVESGRVCSPSRRDDREPVLRGQLGAAVARRCMPSRWARPSCCWRCWRECRGAACARPGVAKRRSAWSPMPTAMRAGCSTPFENVVRMAAPTGRWTRRRSSACSARAPCRYDKGGDQFFDAIRRCIAVRGSSLTALYWFARMVDGGVDPRQHRPAPGCAWPARTSAWLILRALLRIALTPGDLRAARFAPRASLTLAQAVFYLAVAPEVQRRLCRPGRPRRLRQAGRLRVRVPAHLRNADPADEGPGARTELPVCPRRAGTDIRPARTISRTGWRRPRAFYSAGDRGRPAS